MVLSTLSPTLGLRGDVGEVSQDKPGVESRAGPVQVTPVSRDGGDGQEEREQDMIQHYLISGSGLFFENNHQ